MWWQSRKDARIKTSRSQETCTHRISGVDKVLDADLDHGRIMHSSLLLSLLGTRHVGRRDEDVM